LSGSPNGLIKAVPFLYFFEPLLRDFTQDIDTHPRILSPLGIMSCRGAQGIWKALESLLHQPMKLLHSYSKDMARISLLIVGNQQGVIVEQGILHPFGRQRPGELLTPSKEE